MITLTELGKWLTNVNGWRLRMMTQHGVRVWQHRTGTLHFEGMEDLTDEQHADILKAAVGLQSSLTVPVLRMHCLSDNDLRDLVMMDREALLAWGWE